MTQALTNDSCSITFDESDPKVSQSSTQSGNNTIARNDFATPVASSSGSSFRPQSPRESLDSDPVLGAGLTEKGKNRAVDLAPALKKRRGAAGANS
ncbi:hypothetical protein PGTUg99_033939 [Puccinia graminis f. sp. tritici]|uniref:Uncharacterized protein n=1 Tax=Puccinia graminis f. sp. tritici TaxID=56615 RepID=A0A5B0S7T4_PUCGR|nr:hypothetical protein PGTUg99_033939 [Puccinia graminis f. sp. tritici]